MTASALASAGRRRAVRDLATAPLIDPLTGPRMSTHADESEPIYAEVVAALGVPGQDIAAGPVVVGEVTVVAVQTPTPKTVAKRTTKRAE